LGISFGVKSNTSGGISAIRKELNMTQPKSVSK
jgi:hypothetical protein